MLKTADKCSFKMDWRLTVWPQITGVPQDSLVTVVKPGLPTAADLYVLPLDNKPAKKSMFVDKVHTHCVTNERFFRQIILFPQCWCILFLFQRIPAIIQAFNDNNVSFVVRGGLQVLVMLADPNAGILKCYWMWITLVSYFNLLLFIFFIVIACYWFIFKG